MIREGVQLMINTTSDYGKRCQNCTACRGECNLKNFSKIVNHSKYFAFTRSAINEIVALLSTNQIAVILSCK